MFCFLYYRKRFFLSMIHTHSSSVFRNWVRMSHWIRIIRIGVRIWIQDDPNCPQKQKKTMKFQVESEFPVDGGFSWSLNVFYWGLRRHTVPIRRFLLTKVFLCHNTKVWIRIRIESGSPDPHVFGPPESGLISQR
jgi:hypothetical protein